MPRLTRLILVFTLLTVASFAQAQGTPADPTAPPASVPVGSSFGLGIASSASGQTLPVAPAGQVPEPEMWLFTLAGVLLAGLLRRRKR